MKCSVCMFCWVCFVCICCLCGCDIQQHIQQAQVGRIGDERAVSREMAAKTISLAFYTKSELAELETVIEFPDVSKEDWSYLYINGAVSLGMLSGDEDGNFYPEQDLTLLQAQYLMNRLAPSLDSEIVIEEDTQNLPISYSLWVELLQTSLEQRTEGATLESYGITEQTQVLLSAEQNLFEQNQYQAEGMNLLPYETSEIRFWEKEGEILLLLEVVSDTPTIQNIYGIASGNTIRLETGMGAVTYPCDVSVESGIFDITLEQGRVTKAQAAVSLGNCTVKRVNYQEIYLQEQGLLEWAEGFRIYDAQTMETQKVSKLICGLDDAEYYLKDGKIAGAVLTKQQIPEQIRVFIGGECVETVTLTSDTNWTIQNSETTKQYLAGEELTIDIESEWFSEGMIQAYGENGLEITMSNGKQGTYAGVMELEVRQEGICVINELPLETYLRGVVPQEMPVSFGQTSLEVQAITARSYAYNQILANTYCGYGAHVSDTVQSQVYQGMQTSAESDAAIKATEGQYLTYQGDVVTTYFYSTSCGYGSASQDVWSADGTFSEEGEPYLASVSYGFQGVRPETESEWLEFFQNWESMGYDANSPWYRWKVYFGVGQLTEITKQTIQQAAQRNAAQVCVQQPDGTFISGLPEGDWGTLIGVSVVDRADSGVIRVLQLQYEHTCIQLKTEYTIRQVLSPTKRTIGEEIYLQCNDGNSLTGQSMLPSAYFAVREMKNEEGTLTGVALYGGGSGHGVGMSQYGVYGLSQQGKQTDEILQYIFPGTEISENLSIQSDIA